MSCASVRAGTAGLLWLLAGPAAAANGDAVYRCGSAYGTRPCVEGRVVDVADPVTAAQTADAARTAAAERRLADQMVRDRRADEAAARPARAILLGSPKVAEAASAPSKKKRKTSKRTGPAGDDDFIVRVPKTKVAKN